jgi:hypothetical protein
VWLYFSEGSPKRHGLPNTGKFGYKNREFDQCIKNAIDYLTIFQRYKFQLCLEWLSD